MINLLPPQPQRGTDLLLLRLVPPHLELPGIRLVFRSQLQDAVPVLQVPQRQPDAVLRVPPPLCQLPERDFLPVDFVLQALQVQRTLFRLALQMFAGRQLLYQLALFGGQILVAHCGPLGFCPLVEEEGLFSALLLLCQLCFQLAAPRLLILQLMDQPLDGAAGLQIFPALASQDVLVVAGVLVPDDSGVLHSLPAAVEHTLQRIHTLHGAGHCGQVLVGQHTQRIVEDFFQRRGPEVVFGQLGLAHFQQHLDQLLILPGIPEPEDPAVDKGFIHLSVIRPICVVGQQILHLLPAQRDHLPASLFIEPNAIGANSPPIAEAEAPLVDSAPAFCPHPDSDGEIFLQVLLFELQVQIPGLLFGVLIVPQQIEIHFFCGRAEGVQTFWTPVAVQDKGDEALCGDGFSGPVISAQEDTPVFQQKFLLIVQPEVQEPQFMHLPAVHPYAPPCSSFDSRLRSIFQRRDRAADCPPVPPAATMRTYSWSVPRKAGPGSNPAALFPIPRRTGSGIVPPRAEIPGG